MHFPPSARMRPVFLRIASCLSLVFQVYATNRRQGVLNVFRGRACRLVLEYVELVQNTHEFHVNLIEVVKYNKSLPVLNAEYVMNDQKAMEHKIWLDGYQKYGMEHIYRRSAIGISTKFCDTVNGGFLFTNNLQNFSNLPRRCPLKLGQVYYVRNFYVNEAATPPTFPGYQWRFDIYIGPEGSKGKNNSVLLRVLFRVEWYDRNKTT